MANDRLLTPAQVARQLNCRLTLILRLIRFRRLTAVKVGRNWRIEPQAVSEYIAAQRQAVPVAEAPAVDTRQLALFDPDAGVWRDLLPAQTAAEQSGGAMRLTLDSDEPTEAPQ